MRKLLLLVRLKDWGIVLAKLGGKTTLAELNKDLEYAESMRDYWKHV